MAVATGLTAVITAAAALALVRVRVHRYSGRHLVGEVTVAGRGLYFSRTPDALWWRMRLRRRIGCGGASSWPGEEPPDAGVREPRLTPPGSGSGTIALDRPD